MARRRQLPRYLHHKAGGQAYVLINQKQHWLGKFGTDESHLRYDEIISKLLAKSKRLKLTAHSLSISELLTAFWGHAKKRYGGSGKGPYGGAVNWRPIIRLLRQRHGSDEPSDFGPLAMRELIDVMAEFGWNRRYLNDQISRIKQIFKWGVSRELVDQDVYFRLRTVDSVRRGEISNLREASEVQQIADDIIDATVPHLSDTVGAMVQIQRLTACRPGELVIMRPADIDRTNDIWRYTPGKHKTQHHDKKRVIAIGPKAQAKLAPFLLRLPDVYCFPTRRKGKYTTDSYRRAIHRACDRAFPAADHLSEDERLAWQSEHRWSPHRLRHTAGYALREEFGLEHVQVTLGHSQARTSEVYAPPIEAKQLEAAAKLG